MSIKNAIKKPLRKLRDAWQVCAYEFNRKLRRNPPAMRQYLQSRPQLDPLQTRIAGELTAQGYSTVSLADLLGDRADIVIPPVRKIVDEFVAGEYVASEERHYRENFRTMSGKDYVVRYYRRDKRRDLNDQIFRMGIEPKILEIVNEYAQMYMRLSGNDIWYTIPLLEERPRTTSQNWHRDYEDEKLVKIFLYCSEVTERTGPFEYIRNSRRGERNHFVDTLANGVIKEGFYPDEASVDAHGSAEDRLVCTCPAYTLLFCDTSGLHRGGFAYDAPRIVATWTFVSPATLVEKSYNLTNPPEASSGLSENQLQALS